MAKLVDAQPGLDPDLLFDGLPSDLWGALVLQVIGQQLSLAADLAFRHAVERVWRLDPPASVEQVDTLGERFRPWRTLAAAYLYSSVEPG